MRFSFHGRRMALKGLISIPFASNRISILSQLDKRSRAISRHSMIKLMRFSARARRLLLSLGVPAWGLLLTVALQQSSCTLGLKVFVGLLGHSR
ncbi:hypothetical protein Mapa_014515 [Marchantia paleacea]|nr:hypothetical protein Mapa_014515 [Marchantia paleacea]